MCPSLLPFAGLVTARSRLQTKVILQATPSREPCFGNSEGGALPSGPRVQQESAELAACLHFTAAGGSNKFSRPRAAADRMRGNGCRTDNCEDRDPGKRL